MPNVYAVNKTESSLSVDSWFVYYINNSNAEIVDVEGTVGEPLPSIGDTVTFGNYPQATSTPEPIEWTVLDVDSVNGKAFLLAKKVLDGKTYGTYSDSTRWSNCSLREWLNSTFKTTAFDSSEQERIILSHIQNPTNSSTLTPGGVDTDDYLFCLSIGEAKNTNYFSDDNARKGYATQHAIDAGVSLEYGRANWWLRSPGNYNIRAAYVYTSGGVNISGTEVYEDYGVRPAMWVSFSGVTTFRCNAFKYTLNGTPYWYVIDGTHDTWTDDLSAWGYTEIHPAPTLPTVTYLSTVYGLLNAASIASGGTSSPLKSRVGGVYDGDYFTKDNSKQYAFFRYNDGVGYKDAGGIFEVAWSQDNYLCAKNVSDGAEDLESVRIAKCSSANAQVVTVYDIEYGDASYAFKFNLSGTYYYSILDSGLHPGEWTDDLAAAGYTEDSPEPPVSLPTVTIYATPSTYCAFNNSGSSVTINAGNSRNMVYYWTGNQYSAIIYDSTKLYSLVSYRNSGTFIGRTGLSCFEYYNPISPSNYLGVANVSSQSITVDAFDYATCSDSSATVITVYDSSNAAYNAFKYTTDGTDYYYVLDGTQTDWTDDLSSIGYRLPVDVLFYFNSSHSQVNFNYSQNNFWYAIPVNASDKTKLENMGLSFESDYLLYNTGFNFEILAVYSDVGETTAQFNLSYLRVGFGDPLGSSYYRACIWSSLISSTSLQTWKCRISKNP